MNASTIEPTQDNARAQRFDSEAVALGLPLNSELLAEAKQNATGGLHGYLAGISSRIGKSFAEMIRNEKAGGKPLTKLSAAEAKLREEADRAEEAAKASEAARRALEITWDGLLRDFERLQQQSANAAAIGSQQKAAMEQAAAHIRENLGSPHSPEVPNMIFSYAGSEAALPYFDRFAADVEQRFRSHCATVAAFAKKHSVPDEAWSDIREIVETIGKAK